MGACSKDDIRTTPSDADFGAGDTQPLDTHSSPSSLSGVKPHFWVDNDVRYFEDTLPFDDNTPFDYALETQPVCLAGETQVLDFAGETQALDDMDDAGDINTPLLEGIDEGVAIDSDGESDRTEVLENVDELVVDDPPCGGGAQSADIKEVPCESSGGHGDKKLLEQTDAIINKQTASGSMPPRFTFLRAESLRKAAVAARSLSHSCQEPLALNNNGGSLPGCSGKVREADQKHDDPGKYGEEIEGFGNKNTCKVASSTARKLFHDDLSTETNILSRSCSDFNGGEGSDKLPTYCGELGGLSYANSQEPGELSQLNALNFVDRFIEDTIMEFDQETSDVKIVEEKSKSLLSTKGQQSLAKRVKDDGKDRKAGIYDWDDSREDEGGGDIFLRRKEDFFEGGCGTHRPKSMPRFQKIKASRFKDDRDGEDELSVPNKRKSVVHSDSRLLLHNLNFRDNTIQEATKQLRRKLANELDEEIHIDCSTGEMESYANAAHAKEVLAVGLDTQMAAEAMEALCNGEDIVDHLANDFTPTTKSSLTDQLKNSSSMKEGPATSKECSGQYDKKRKVVVKSNLQTSSISNKCTGEVRQCKKVRRCKKNNVMKRSKRSKLLNTEDIQTSSANEEARKFSSRIIEKRKSAGTSERRQLDELNNCDSNDRGTGESLVHKKHLHGKVFHLSPIAHRTRQSSAINQLMKPNKPSKKLRGKDVGIDSLEKNNGTDIQASKALDAKYTIASVKNFGADDDAKLGHLEKLVPKSSAVSNGIKVDTVDCTKRRRSLRKLSNHDEGSEKLVGLSKPSAVSENTGRSTSGKRKRQIDARNIVQSHVNRQTQSSSFSGSVKSSIQQKQGTISEPNLDKANTGDAAVSCNVMDEKVANLKSDGNNAGVLLSTKNLDITSSDESPRERYKSSDLASTPANCKTPVNDTSPVCMGDDYYKQSCNRNLSRSCLLKVFHTELHRELRSLSAIRPELTTPSKDSRRRRDMTEVRILYSHHLDEDIIKHQKKILARLGASVTSSITDATHFIADQFVRTRNMLEAMASGKPVVTHLWIESCGQASCFIDERNYILRDAKKEKEFGFSMPVSLARASKHPLLEGRRVLITSNTKPSKEIISSLIKAVQGQAVERLGRSALKDDKIPDDLLILSCEEDYASCVPFLEKGASVYSSELLLNGIVTQKLDYERHRLFADHVKKTRSTIWLKKDGKSFLPVTKCT